MPKYFSGLFDGLDYWVVKFGIHELRTKKQYTNAIVEICLAINELNKYRCHCTHICCCNDDAKRMLDDLYKWFEVIYWNSHPDRIPGYKSEWGYMSRVERIYTRGNKLTNSQRRRLLAAGIQICNW